MSSPSKQRPELPKLTGGSPEDPASFGKYYLLGLIARGGMAEVYRAKPKNLPVPTPTDLLAIKVMRPQLAREARFVDMFIREGNLARLLKHPNIVETFDVGKIEQRYFIAMEYIGGKDLTQILRRCQETTTRIPVPHAVYIASKIALGLHYAHALKGEDDRPLNIVNRDVSPSNVRISYDGNVKLLDFGIAQALMKFTSEIGILKGKFSYMSPEQIRGMPVDARTDVFSAGIILHEMLTTEKLFRGDTEFALMEKVRKAQVPPPSKFNKRVNEDLDRIALKALARDVGERYQSAAEFAADLDGFLQKYRFDNKELQDFVRSLFRSDYTKELEEVTQCLAAMPGGSQPELITQTVDEASIDVITDEPPTGESPPPRAADRGSASAGAAPAPTAASAPTASDPSKDPGGSSKSTMWSKLKSKFTK